MGYIAQGKWGCGFDEAEAEKARCRMKPNEAEKAERME